MSVASNETSSGREALEVALHMIAEHTGWPVGHIYTVEGDPARDDERLVPLNIWAHPDDPALLPFREATLDSEFASGTGLPGRVLAAKQPCWIPDVTNDDNFPRRDTARPVGWPPPSPSRCWSAARSPRSWSSSPPSHCRPTRRSARSWARSAPSSAGSWSASAPRTG